MKLLPLKTEYVLCFCNIQCVAPSQALKVGLRSGMFFLWVSEQPWWSQIGLLADMLVSDQACRSPIRHVSLQWISDEACRSPMRHVGYRWVSDQTFWSLMNLRSISDRSPIILIFSWTPKSVLFWKENNLQNVSKGGQKKAIFKNRVSFFFKIDAVILNDN